ncbi:unnamed protein product [Medioppia subpectinata]|uniref:BTB domain-containing protein n=1 Tax=Medioppia subpectinata TaxID=1979941 RepID=A0A7R9KPG4_9ACAR|nr:unnamed protein product [Medioppia subpectinata]CAG2106106.1 unnamed protein product [Medioppia subpectinata]
MSARISLSDSSAVTTYLCGLYRRQELTDTRIVCTDGSLVAHRLVLSAVWPQLRAAIGCALKTTPAADSSPLVVMVNDIGVDDMRAILDVVYFGRQVVDAQSGQRLQRLANRLDIKLKSQDVKPRTPAVAAAKSADLLMPSIAVMAADEGVKTSAPTPRHKCLLSSDKKRLSAKQSIDVIADQLTMEIPIDLTANSAPNPSPEDTVMNTIESIVTNGSGGQSPPLLTAPPKTNRRRKQSSPKTTGAKSAKYVDNNNTNGSPVERPLIQTDAPSANGPPVETSLPVDSAADNWPSEPSKEDFINELVLSKLAEVMATSQVDFTLPSMITAPVVDDIAAVADIQLTAGTVAETESIAAAVAKTESTAGAVNGVDVCLESTPKPKPKSRSSGKPLGRPVESPVDCDQHTDCPVCLVTCDTLKQLIAHLNADHRTEPNGFRCQKCLKDMKYAKTLVKHSIQCKPQ